MTFRNYQPGDFEALVPMVLGLYTKDGSKPTDMSAEKVSLSVAKLTGPKSTGELFIFELEGDLAGYAIINRFWSNEFSGEILYVDELYVRASFRSKGIGAEFLTYLRQNAGEDAVAFMLETTKDNTRAVQFYGRLGFSEHHNYLMFKRF